MISNKVVLQAVRRANRLGARGIRVVGFLAPWLATQDPELILLTDKPQEETACEPLWYE